MMPRLVTKSEAAKLLGVSRPTVYAMIKSGRLRVVSVTPTVRRIPFSLISAIMAGVKND